MTGSAEISAIEDLFKNGNLQILIPQQQLSEAELGVEDAARVLERILGDTQRSQVFYDETLEFFVKLDVPVAGVTLSSSTIQGFLNNTCLTLTGEASSLIPPIQDRLLSTPTGTPNLETPNANRGLGVRTPGFPYTPAPWPSHDDASSVEAKAYTSGPAFSTCSWQSGRWTDVTSSSPFILWRMRMGGLTRQREPGVRSLLSLTVTMACASQLSPIRTSLSLKEHSTETSVVTAPVLRRQGSLPPPPVPDKPLAKQRPSSEYMASPNPASAAASQMATSETKAPTSSDQSVRFHRRSCRKILPIAQAVHISTQLLASRKIGKTTKYTLCLALKGGETDGVPFRVQSVQVASKSGTVVPLSQQNDGEASMLLPNEQHNLLYQLEIEDSSGAGLRRSLPPATPLAALLSPSQVLTSGRPFDPRMRIPGQKADLSLAEANTELEVTVFGYPLPDALQRSGTLHATEPYKSIWKTSLTDNKERVSRRSASPAVSKGSHAMLKSASLIGSRKGPYRHEDDAARVRIRPISDVPLSKMVQASAGSARHSIASLYDASRNMAAQSYRGNSRPSLQRHNSTQRGSEIGMGAPPSAHPSSNMKGPLPPHMAAHARPQLDSPRRSYSASSVPTFNSPTMATSLLPESPSIAHRSIQETYPTESTTQYGTMSGEPEQINKALPSASLLLPQGRLLATISLLSMRETAASLGLGQPAGQGSAADTALRARLASFKLGSQAATPLHSPDTSENLPAGLTTATGFSLFDVFLVEVFVANQSTLPCALSVRFEQSSADRGGVIPLDNSIHIRSLQAGACQAVRARFLTLQSGAHALGDVIIRDLDTQQDVTLSTGLTVLVR